MSTPGYIHCVAAAPGPAGDVAALIRVGTYGSDRVSLWAMIVMTTSTHGIDWITGEFDAFPRGAFPDLDTLGGAVRAPIGEAPW